MTLRSEMTINDATLNALLGEFLAEAWAVPRPALPQDAAQRRHLLRALMNLRPPLPARPKLIELQVSPKRRTGRTETANSDSHRTELPEATT